MKTPFFKVVFAIIRKDLRAELRSRDLVGAMGLFALLSVLIFSFALELDNIARQSVVTGVLWVTIVFSSILGLNRSLAQEQDQGNMYAMLLAPIDRNAIYFGKMVGNFLFTVIIGLILLPVMTVLYNITLTQLELVATLIFGVLGISIVGTLLATMTVQTRARETLLPIVMLPIILPILIAVIRASSGIISGNTTDSWTSWLQLVIFIDVIYATLSFLLFAYIIET